MNLLRWLTFLRGSLTVTLTVLLFWFYLFLLKLVFVLQWLSLHFENVGDHVGVSVSIDFPTNSKRDVLFHHIAYDCSHADWDGLWDHLRDIPWEDIFKLIASVAASEFCEWVQVGIDVYIAHHKYQVKPHSSPHKSSESKGKFRQASNCCKRVLEAAKLVYATKTK